MLEELASGSRPLTVPVRSSSSSSNSGGSGVVQIFDDCGFHGRWQHLYDDEGHQFVDYEPFCTEHSELARGEYTRSSNSRLSNIGMSTHASATTAAAATAAVAAALRRTLLLALLGAADCA
jgi:hypothetical protein